MRNRFNFSSTLLVPRLRMSNGLFTLNWKRLFAREVVFLRDVLAISTLRHLNTILNIICDPNTSERHRFRSDDILSKMAVRLEKQMQNINGIPSLVSKIHAENFDTTKCRKAVVVIPGNPGIIRFYDSFLESLYNECEGRLPMFGIQHAGHGTLENVTIHKSTFSLEEQIDHKIAFLEKYFPPFCKFILIGHSIGAYMILKLFEHFGKQQQRITKGILLFPTIERMAISPSGRLATPISKYFSWPLVAAAWSLSWLPLRLKRWLIDIWFSWRKVDEGCKEAVVQLITANSIRNMLYMGADEMEKVDKTPVELISDHIDKLIFYYGASDPWTPRMYYNEMVHRFPTAQIYLCERNMRHAFILESHHEMATIAAGWID